MLMLVYFLAGFFVFIGELLQLPTIGAFKHLAAEMPEIAVRRGLFHILRR